MSDQLTAASTAQPQPAPDDDDLGIDRDFLLKMAQIPFLAIGWTAAAWLAHLLWGATVGDLTQPPEGSPANLGPLVVVCIGMILAAIIDGWAFRVPNWLTLSLVVSGWYLGILHEFGVAVDAGRGGFGSAFSCTLVGFFLLFPLLPIRGMGEGDVKMTMGFASWLGAFYGYDPGLKVLLIAFVAGVIVGGIFGLVMMACRRQFYKNWQNTVEIARDVGVLLKEGPSKAAARAEERHKYRVRLPYGVPLCVGFLGYLAYFYLNN